MFETSNRHLPCKLADRSVKSRLRTCGFKKIGAGCYASVYGAPGADHVYKVGDLHDNEGYLAYLKVVHRNGKNPFFPRIHALQYVTGRDMDGDVFVVKMERLKPLTNREVYAMDDIAGVMVDLQDTQSKLDTIHGLGMIRVDRTFREAIIAIARAARRNFSHLDLHGGNFMRRGSQLVITDPLS